MEQPTPGVQPCCTPTDAHLGLASAQFCLTCQHSLRSFGDAPSLCKARAQVSACAACSASFEGAFSAARSDELGVADVLVAGHDAIALKALVVGARDLVQAGQRALEA